MDFYSHKTMLLGQIFQTVISLAVDCKPVKALHDFYERNLFIMIDHNDDNDLDQFVHFLNRKRFDFGKIVEF